MAAATRHLLAGGLAGRGRCSPQSAPARLRQLPAPPRTNRTRPSRAGPRPSPGQPRGSAHHPRPSAPAGTGLQSSASRLRGPQSGGPRGPPGRPRFGHLPLRPLLALDPGQRSSPAASRLPLPRAAPVPRPPAPLREPLGATSASGEHCVCRAAGGAGGGGRRRQRSGGSAPRTAGSEAGKVGAVPPPGPGPRSAPAARPRTPRPSARDRVTGPHVPTAASTRLGPGTLAARRRQRVRRCLATPPCPLPAAARLPRETDVGPAGLGCAPAAGTPPSRPLRLDTHPSLPANLSPLQPRR